MFLAGRPELAQLPDGLVSMQLQAQARQRLLDHPNATIEALVLDTVDVGVLVTAYEGAAVHLVDITLAPDHRGRRIGTTVLTELAHDATATGREVRLHVWSENASARRLYERLGFGYDDNPDHDGHLAMTLRAEETSGV
ncbi:MAG: GCN5-related N-acetyltransferase [Nocardioidaceae bacterium]|nr:GCN5-related N-acetyltransferase [Nocardioidaceae bacterium]